MRLYEFEAKKILSEFGIPVPQGKVITSPEQAKRFTEVLKKPVVLKSQILSGGRGKAGGIKFAQTPDEAYSSAK